MKKLDNVTIYNPDGETGIIAFNIKNVFPQDGASFLSSKGIAVRAGTHCAKTGSALIECVRFYAGFLILL